MYGQPVALLWQWKLFKCFEGCKPLHEQPLWLALCPGYSSYCFFVERGFLMFFCWLHHPIAPAMSSCISLLSSTAYSIGSSFIIGSMNPDTISLTASSSLSPLLMR